MKKVIGYVLYACLKHLNIRLVLPRLGDYVEHLRIFSLRLVGANIGRNSHVRPHCSITFPRNLTIGNNSKINNGASLFLFDKMTIGSNVEIGPEFLVYTAEHNLDNPFLPLTKQGTYNVPVVVEDDVYIGARVTLLKGSYVESRVVIAAGAVVAGRLKSGCIYGGIPAKKIGTLKGKNE